MITYAEAIEAAGNALRKAEEVAHLEAGGHWIQIADRWFALATHIHAAKYGKVPHVGA